MTCRVVRSGVLLVLAVVFVVPLFASTNEEARVRDATRVLQDILDLPGKGIPVSLLSEASGIMVIPGVIKAGYIIGGRHGRGILVAHQDDGQWSNPVFITLRAGSIGWQIGVQSTDLVLLFRSQKSVESIVQEELTLGADASVAAGPHGRGIGTGTDV